MVKVSSSTGIEKDFHLDFDAICSYENQHKDWSIMDEFDQLSKMRFSSLNLLATFIGCNGWADFVKEGFTVENLASIIESGLAELGFTSTDAKKDGSTE
ncbi:MAG: hypothetical protein E7Z65_06420 [Thermoplasmata archaeon]|nr:hypothetical protein [Thermoplasmata archaeon]